MTEEILGYRVTVSDRAELADEMVEWVERGQGCKVFACMNPHTFVAARAGERLSAALRSVDWLVPDGVGVLLASRVLGGRIRARVTGHDLFTGVLERLNRRGRFRVFFLGSSPATLEEIRSRFVVDYPNLEVAGMLPGPPPGIAAVRPPFPPMSSPEERQEILSAIRRSRADVLWVAMTAPKQELWLHENRTELDVRLAGAIGAVFDFYAGRIRRPGPAFQSTGLEWLPRLLQEPRRLWRRMFISAPVFLWHVLKARLARRSGTGGRRGTGSDR